VQFRRCALPQTHGLLASDGKGQRREHDGGRHQDQQRHEELLENTDDHAAGGNNKRTTHGMGARSVTAGLFCGEREIFMDIAGTSLSRERRCPGTNTHLI
jgi:hypothetical protein